jgi:hypothetical protein
MTTEGALVTLNPSIFLRVNSAKGIASGRGKFRGNDNCVCRSDFSAYMPEILHYVQNDK